MTKYTNPTINLDSDSSISTTTLNIPDKYYEKVNVYFAFIDVLGFKEAYDKSLNNKKVSKKFEEVFMYYFYLINNADFYMSSEIAYAGQTSDSLYFYTDRLDYLIEYIKIFSHLNVFAMTQNVFFRGGIAKGSLSYKADYQFFGKSVIDAYLLENQIAKLPIIVMQDSIYKEIIEHYSNIISSESFGEKNNRHYIQPFAYLTQKFKLNINGVQLKEIKKTTIAREIKKNIKEYEFNNEVYKKFIFLNDNLKCVKTQKA